MRKIRKTTKRFIPKTRLFVQAHKYAAKLKEFRPSVPYIKCLRRALRQGYATYHDRNAWGTSLRYRNFWEA